MSGTKRILIRVLLLVSLAFGHVFPMDAQPEVDTSRLAYASVHDLLFLDTDVPDAILVDDRTGFNVGDTVMVYISRGFLVDRDAGQQGDINNGEYIGYTGKYSILIISEIVESVYDTIKFNAPTGFKVRDNEPKRPGDMGQLIKVLTYENARVTSSIGARPWNPVTGTGGVLPLYVKKKLTLLDDIDVSGQGFRGAVPAGGNYGNGCYPDIPGLTGYFYTMSANDSSGIKGEGAGDATFSLLRGRSRLINGGGGGNARYSGGGGGSNFSRGGEGGTQSFLCASDGNDLLEGIGGIGFNSKSYYQNDDWENTLDDLFANRVFMGGGGGTGTYDPDFEATAGGNGGGVVIIIADTLESNAGVTISADGETVTDIATGAGGGGGGGGAILLDVSHYEGTINLSAKGGDGGDTRNISNGVYTGPGGGGGGGVYWLRYDSSNVSKTVSPGSGGIWLDGPLTNKAEDGSTPGVVTDINPPLNGFLFNTLPGDKMVCTDETPPPINASRPKGGDGNYDFQWEYKPASSPVWLSNPVDTLEDFYFKGPLLEDTEFRRIVTSAGLDPEGFDVTVTYTILDKIRGNGILAPDTVCAGLAPVPLIEDPDSTVSGANGAGSYSYQWLQSTDGGASWNDVPAAEQTGYAPPGLQETTLYARLIESGVCNDTSEFVTITVLDSIKNNDISSDTILCYGQTPAQFTGPKPAGGDPALFSYRWQGSDDPSGPFSDLVTTQNHQAPALFDTTYYRRIYFSGSQDACIDTSNLLEVTVLPLIDDNVILSADDTICENAQLLPAASAQQPTGGDGFYTHIWQVSTDLSGWGDSTTYLNTNGSFNLSAFTDTTYIRRKVISGADNVCQDISDTMTVTIVPSVLNNTISTADFTICQGIFLPQLDAQPVTGGDGTFGYLWETSPDGTSDWSPAAVGGDNAAEDLAPDTLVATTYFRRRAWSDASRAICMTISDTIAVIVQNRITSNRITHPLNYVCYDEDLEITGTDQDSPDALSGGAGPPFSFTWQQSADGSFATPADVGSGRDYNESNYVQQRFFRRIVSSGECTDTTGGLEIEVKRLPYGQLALAPGEFTDPCEFDPVVFQLTFREEPDVTDYDFAIAYSTIEGSGELTGTQAGADGTFEHEPSTEDSTVYTYQFSYVGDSNGCVAPPDSLAGTVVIKVYETPEAEITGAPEQVCGPVVTLNAVRDRGGVGHWEKIGGSPSVIFDPPDDETTLITIDPLDNDSATLSYAWILETPRCGSADTVTIVHWEDPAPPPYFTKDTVRIYFADEYQAEVDIPPTAGIGTWSVAPGSFGAVPDGSHETSVLLTGLELSTSPDPADLRPNTFIWTVNNGECGKDNEYFDEITIIRQDVTQYDGFSPNSDDKNRYYTMRGVSGADDFTFTIFNSWGTKIKTVTRADAEAMGRIDQGDGALAVTNEYILWDGTARDGVTPVPDGTYYYNITLQVGDETYTKKGFILLKTRM